MPKESKSAYYSFSLSKIHNDIKSKKQIKIKMTDDKITNQKKIKVISYEIRKLKYTTDSNTVVYLTFSNEMNYSEMLIALRLCMIEGLKHYTLVKSGFIMFPGYIPPPKDPTKKIELIYLKK